MPSEYEVVVVGGGPGGLTTALYTTRLGHETALIDRGGGRHTTVEHAHNLLGISEGTSGREITDLGFEQLAEYGADRYTEHVERVTPAEDRDREFRVETGDRTVLTDRVVLATGFRDAPPSFPELTQYTGHGLHYCLHCDAYSLIDEPVFVFGHGNSAAHVAMVMLNFTADVDLLLDGEEPDWDEELGEQLRAHPVDVHPEEAVEVHPDDPDAEKPWIEAIGFADGTRREYTGGFAMYGSSYNNELATTLGCELVEDGAVRVDDYGRTTAEGVYAVGDVAHGHNQTPIAMGDGARAGIALHHELRTFPLSAGAGEPNGTNGEGTVEVEVPAVPDEVRENAREVKESDEHAGMSPDG